MLYLQRNFTYDLQHYSILFLGIATCSWYPRYTFYLYIKVLLLTRLAKPIDQQDWYVNCLPFQPTDESVQPPTTSRGPNHCCIQAGMKNVSSNLLRIFFCIYFLFYRWGM